MFGLVLAAFAEELGCVSIWALVVGGMLAVLGMCGWPTLFLCLRWGCRGLNSVTVRGVGVFTAATILLHLTLSAAIEHSSSQLQPEGASERMSPCVR